MKGVYLSSQQSRAQQNAIYSHGKFHYGLQRRNKYRHSRTGTNQNALELCPFYKKAKYMTIDISNMYLNTPLDCLEYMRMKLIEFPQEIIDEYKLNDLVNSHGWIYMEICKALPGLCQSGALAAKKLAVDLKPFGYYNVPKTNGLWKH